MISGEWIKFSNNMNILLTQYRTKQNNDNCGICQIFIPTSEYQTNQYLHNLLNNAQKQQIQYKFKDNDNEYQITQNITKIINKSNSTQSLCLYSPNISIFPKNINQLKILHTIKQQLGYLQSISPTECFHKFLTTIFLYSTHTKSIVHYRFDKIKNIQNIILSERLLIHVFMLIMVGLLQCQSMVMYIKYIRQIHLQIQQILAKSTKQKEVQQYFVQSNLNNSMIIDSKSKIGRILSKFNYNANEAINLKIGVHLIDIQIQRLLYEPTERFQNKKNIQLDQTAIIDKKVIKHHSMHNNNRIQHNNNRTQHNNNKTQHNNNKTQHNNNKTQHNIYKQRLKHSNSMGNLQKNNKRTPTKTSKNLQLHRKQKNKSRRNYRKLNFHENKNLSSSKNREMWYKSSDNFGQNRKLVQSINFANKDCNKNIKNWYYNDTINDFDTNYSTLKQSFIKKYDSVHKQSHILTRIKNSKQQGRQQNYKNDMEKQVKYQNRQSLQFSIHNSDTIIKDNIDRVIKQLCLQSNIISAQIIPINKKNRLKHQPCIFDINISANLSVAIPQSVTKQNNEINRQSQNANNNKNMNINKDIDKKNSQYDQVTLKQKNITKNNIKSTKNQAQKQSNPNNQIKNVRNPKYYNYLGSVVAFLRSNLNTQKIYWSFPSFIIYLHYALFRFIQLPDDLSPQILDSNQKIAKSLKTMQSFLNKNAQNPIISQYIKMGGRDIIDYDYGTVFKYQNKQQKIRIVLQAIHKDSVNILKTNYQWCKLQLMKKKAQLINKNILKPFMKYSMLLNLSIIVISDIFRDIPQIDQIQHKKQVIDSHQSQIMIDLRTWISQLQGILDKYQIL